MREQDRASFDAWARARQQSLVRTAYLLTGDFHRAEDLVQEALVKAAMQWSSLQHGNPDAWVRTVVHRTHISWWRSRHREWIGGEVPERPSPAPGDGAMMLRAALAALPPRQRAAVVLRYVDDMTAQQAADVLGVTVGTIKKNTSVALERLRTVAPELEQLTEEQR